MQTDNLPNTTLSLDNSPDPKNPEGVPLDGHFHTSRLRNAKPSSSPPRFLWLIDRHPALHILLSELCSVLGRIRFRLSPQFPHVSMGPAFQLGPTGQPEECSRTRTCMIDTGRFVSSRKWATLVDVQTFLEGCGFVNLVWPLSII
jgi:hypothetical protein